MKTLIRSLIFNLIALHLAVSYIPGVSFHGGLKAIGIAALVLAVFNLLLRPIINLLLLPINLLTLGLFRWVVNVIILYLLVIVSPNLKIYGFGFSGFSFQNFSLPAFFVSPFWNTVLTSFFISFILGVLYWLK